MPARPEIKPRKMFAVVTKPKYEVFAYNIRHYHWQAKLLQREPNEVVVPVLVSVIAPRRRKALRG